MFPSHAAVAHFSLSTVFSQAHRNLLLPSPLNNTFSAGTTENKGT
jgi:hypothetical protein